MRKFTCTCICPAAYDAQENLGGMRMGIAVFGADERLKLLREMLSETGADAVSAENEEDFEGREIFIGKYPFDAPVEKGILRMRAGAKLILLNAGPVDERFSERFQVYPLMDDTVFVNENALFTAEGAVFRAMQVSSFALSGENIAVIGYGRIGRMLTEMLVGLNAEVTVFSRRESGRLQAMARGAKGASCECLCPMISDKRIIFVTSPDRILSLRELSYVSKDAFLFDLSSKPYGIDHEAARKLALSLHVEGALPGRYCPQSAARSMYRAVRRITGGVGL